MKKYAIFTHMDLDGAGSQLVMQWMFPKIKFEIKGVSTTGFKSDFINWSNQNTPADYEKIFFLDLEVTQYADLIDMPNAVIIDHHKISVENKDVFVHAKTCFEVCDSCTLLIYKHFRDKLNVTLTEEQKKLILLINDYDCYRLQFPESEKLNVVWGGMQGQKLTRFSEAFTDGFRGFNQLQENLIRLRDQALRKQKDECNVFVGDIPIQKKNRTVVATFVTDYPNEIAQHLIDEYSADIAIAINLRSKRVSFRKSKECDADLSIIAQKLCGGGGHAFASGGNITDEFMEFTKLLQPFEAE